MPASRNLSRSLNRSCSRQITKRLGIGRRPRRPDELQIACRLLSQALRVHQRMVKRDPHLFGPHAHRYYLDTLQCEQDQREVQAALERIYGPPLPGQPGYVSAVWTDRYVFRTEEQRRIHRRWFKEQYGE